MSELIKTLIRMDSEYKCDFIYGNHDAWCRDWLDNGEVNRVWQLHGGKSTLKSYESVSEEEKDQHLLFFTKMQNYIIDDQNRLFIHAGFSSMHGPDKEDYSTNYRWDRTLWEMAMAVHGNVDSHDEVFPKRFKLFKEIYIGHTPTTEWNVSTPWNRVNLWNVDTGTAFKGKLSIMDINTKEFWQSDNLYELYPNENGRNKI
ncbi:MAG: serine/threonine protein phosphatase [Flavobacteriales bacterium]|nr:serine/threonine protein phosphatase [Flavobacteriales bacterium]